MTNPVIGYLAGVIWPRSLALLKAMSPNVFALCQAAAGGLGGVERSRKARVICFRSHPSPTLFRLVDGGDSGNQALNQRFQCRTVSIRSVASPSTSFFSMACI